MRQLPFVLFVAACSPARVPAPSTTEVTSNEEEAPQAPEDDPPEPSPHAPAITGAVHFTGEAMPMQVPTKRAEAEYCKDIEVLHNAIVVNDGKLQDVWVGIDDEQVRAEVAIPGPKVLDVKDCQFGARIVGLMPGQEIQLGNSDQTLHNPVARAGRYTFFNVAQPRGAPVEKKTFDDPGIVRLSCDVHVWERAFLVVTDNPFSDVTKADGTYRIPDVPDGEYTLVAWHSFFGKKTAKIKVRGHRAEQDFSYLGDEEEPSENTGELDDLF